MAAAPGLQAEVALFVAVAWAWLVWQGTATTAVGDREALMSLKSGVDPWSISFSSCVGSWDFGFDPCDPQSAVVFVCGFGCEGGAGGQMRVTKLILDYGGYSGTLSPAIGDLTALQVLDVSGNSFRGVLPETLGRLTLLQHLDVSGNGLSGGIPSSLGSMPRLQYLSLANNGFQGRIPSAFNRLSGLTDLYLNGNRLRGPIPVLDNLSQLRYFDASSNALSGHVPYALPRAVVRLSLRDNQLAGLLPRNLNRLTSLAVLDLAGNRLRGCVSPAPFLLPALQQLNLSNNAFSCIRVPDMAGVGSVLLAIDVSSNFMTGALPLNFAYMQHLHSLSLRQNGFSGAIPVEYAQKVEGRISGVDRFDRLLLDDNYLTGSIPPALLSPIPDLTASLVGNCLDSCPSYVKFCQGGRQRSPSACSKSIS